MNNEYIYSAENNAFYAISMTEAYKTAGTWPDDGIEVSKEVYTEFAINQPKPGKFRNAGNDGMPCWQDIPPPNHEEQQQQSERQKSDLIKVASNAIAPLQDAVDLEMATDDEKLKLTAWKNYRVLLNRVDTSTAPDITWPASPTTSK